MLNNTDRIVLIGSNGMLGRALATVFADANLVRLGHHDLDITQPQAVLDKMTQLQPRIILNAAAYTKVDDCETNQSVANLVNGAAPGWLATAAQLVNATLVHYSTDYVFSGSNPVGYSETDQPDHPVNAYGRSKLLGEQAVQLYPKHYLIRTAWLFGQAGSNFVDTMLQLAKTHDQLSVVNDQHGSPTYAHDLALATAALLADQAPFGTYHLTNSGTCTWYEFAQAIFTGAKLATTVTPCTSAAFPRPARRPSYSILLNTKRPLLPAWQTALAHYLSVLTDKEKA